MHQEINEFYSSIQSYTDGQTVRKWLETKSYDEQWEFGMDKVQRVLRGERLR